MEKSSFFNAELVGEEYDRTYLAEDYAQYFASFIGNGVFPNPSNNLQVIADGTSMNVVLKSGKAWINGYFYNNTDDLILVIAPADGVLNRIDRVVLRLDFLNREIKAYVKKGVFASSPIAQTLQRDADMYEIGIADIKVNKGAIAITQANITDLRQDNNYCGIVHGTVDQVDVTTLFNQYSKALELKEQGFEEEFTTWFNNIKGQLSGDVATNLAVQIDDLKTSKVNYTDLTPVVTTGTSSAYVATIPANMTEVTIVPHVNNISGATLNSVPILDREGKPIEKDTLKANIPSKIVRVGNSFFIASGGGGYADAIEKKVLYSKRGTGTAKEIIKKDSRIKTIYEYIKKYNFDVLPTATVNKVSVSDDAKKLIIYSNNQIILYRLINNVYIKQPTLLTQSGIQKIKISGDGTYITFAYGTSPYIKAFRLNDDNTLTELSFDIPISDTSTSSLKINYDASIIAVISGTSRILTMYKKVNDIFTKMTPLNIAYAGAVNDASVSNDGKTLVICGNNSPYVLSYKINSDGTIIKQPVNHPISTGCYEIEISEDGNSFVTSRYTDGQYIYYFKRDDENATFSNVSQTYVGSGDINALIYKNGNVAIICSGTRYCYRISEDGKIKGISTGSSYQYLDITMSEDGNMVYGGGTSNEYLNTGFIDRAITNVGYELYDLYALKDSGNLEQVGLALSDGQIGERVDYIGLWGV